MAERFVPRDVFETLHFSALAAGGVGAGYGRDPFKPMCIVEHIVSVEDASPKSSSWITLLYKAGITRETNDKAVREVNKRLGRFGTKWVYKCPNPKLWCDDDDFGDAAEDCEHGADTRVQFESWAAELELMPDDSETPYGELYNGDPVPAPMDYESSSTMFGDLGSEP